MYCPRCGTEYERDTRDCPACGVRLVRHRPQAEPALLCTTTSAVELALIESLLAGLELPYSVVGANVMRDYAPVRVLVRPQDLTRAQEVLATLKEPTEVAPAETPPVEASVRSLVTPAEG